MLTQPILSALNKQLSREYYASYLYLAISAFFEENGYTGFASWMREHSQEEYEHMMKLYRYILTREGQVKFESISTPHFKGTNALEIIQEACAHEKKMSTHIDELVSLSIKENDHPTNNFLQWFVAEQVEEESLFQSIAQKLILIGDNKSALYMIDRELNSRSDEK